MAIENEDLLREIIEIKADLKNHIQVEEPVLLEARALIVAHGSYELIGPRVAFINAWMRREEQRDALRRAIIEKTTIAAVWAIVLYVAYAIGHDIMDTLRGISGYK